MPVRKKTTGNNLRSKSTAKMFEAAQDQRDKPKDAIALLKADHQEATELYKAFEKAKGGSEKKSLAGEICLALSVHMRIEEDIFYPAMQKALGQDRDLVAEAKVEHASLKNLISQVEGAPESEEFEAQVKVMSEYTKHHVKEEETEMFPKAQASGVDLVAIGQKLQNRKLELLEAVANKAASKSPPKPSSLFRARVTPQGRGNGSRSQHART